MLVDVVAVHVVAVAVVQVVDVVAVLDGLVPAVGAVLMIVLGVLDAAAGAVALVPVALVLAVQVAVVDVVDVVVVGDAGVAAVGAVPMVVVAVGAVVGGGAHGSSWGSGLGERGLGESGPFDRVRGLRLGRQWFVPAGIGLVGLEGIGGAVLAGVDDGVGRDVRDVVVDEGVADLPADPATGDDPCGAEHLEVLGHGRLGEVEQVDQFVHAVLVVAEGDRDPQARRVCQCLEQLGRLGEPGGVAHRFSPGCAHRFSRGFGRGLGEVHGGQSNSKI